AAEGLEYLLAGLPVVKTTVTGPEHLRRGPAEDARERRIEKGQVAGQVHLVVALVDVREDAAVFLLAFLQRASLFLAFQQQVQRRAQRAAYRQHQQQQAMAE